MKKSIGEITLTNKDEQCLIINMNDDEKTFYLHLNGAEHFNFTIKEADEIVHAIREITDPWQP